MLRIKQANKKGYIECVEGGVANLLHPSSTTRRGRVVDQGRVSPTLQTEIGVYVLETEYRIRKLTPLECWRLMGFKDEDFYMAKEVNSDTQLYKQAGNAIVREVMMAVFSQLNIKGVDTFNKVHDAEVQESFL